MNSFLNLQNKLVNKTNQNEKRKKIIITIKIKQVFISKII